MALEINLNAIIQAYLNDNLADVAFTGAYSDLTGTSGSSGGNIDFASELEAIINDLIEEAEPNNEAEE